MKRTIGDSTAIAFATGFYRGLGAGRTITEAYQSGLVEIEVHLISEDRGGDFYGYGVEVHLGRWMKGFLWIDVDN